MSQTTEEMKTEKEVVRLKDNKKTKHEEVNLKGTFASVMLLGGFLIITWLAVFILFLVRNG
ncbi:cytochrome c oxidase subunit 2A [Longirhabdus pacifica]|uniref:cytochrome c oxidase subunit 2A n=1 Tax=Longirhabdus pacifica TaxID=2305227 RepID=UPI0027B8979C|nr:cytochrome c oxidase subunit 2A [Longirhabdus pacifica]